MPRASSSWLCARHMRVGGLLDRLSGDPSAFTGTRHACCADLCQVCDQFIGRCPRRSNPPRHRRKGLPTGARPGSESRASDGSGGSRIHDKETASICADPNPKSPQARPSAVFLPGHEPSLPFQPRQQLARLRLRYFPRRLGTWLCDKPLVEHRLDAAFRRKQGTKLMKSLISLAYRGDTRSSEKGLPVH